MIRLKSADGPKTPEKPKVPDSKKKARRTASGGPFSCSLGTGLEAAADPRHEGPVCYQLHPIDVLVEGQLHETVNLGRG